MSVGLEITAGRYFLSFVFVDDGWNDSEFVEAITGPGHILVESGYPELLTIHMCDDTFALMKTLKVEAMMM